MQTWLILRVHKIIVLHTNKFVKPIACNSCLQLDVSHNTAKREDLFSLVTSQTVNGFPELLTHDVGFRYSDISVDEFKYFPTCQRVVFTSSFSSVLLAKFCQHNAAAAAVGS
jgi:hypothetical protein